jgi:adenylate cyclase
MMYRGVKRQSKIYGFSIIVGSATALAAKDKFAILEIDFIAVKGRRETGSRLCHRGARRRGEFRAVPADSQPDDRNACKLSRTRLGPRPRNHPAGRTVDGADDLKTIFDLYEERLQELKTEPPGENRNGVTDLQHK